ncbi:uncharacterized protein BJ171DRAFT_535088 [Polychytrium aggregatum]|uniref:uncharacterized protein n=1 Tax=Polychytrium aggregatum TaxID=110093 RepID=UPI0022FEFCE7|nr:uncharacterized protein BJ171DRAFT_535088 [Polychytrium aggregatum]KAI9193037.1 hypothetical protein BJ171DRAFT_535088 [Polychytrium aggregatum]
MDPHNRQQLIDALRRQPGTTAAVAQHIQQHAASQPVQVQLQPVPVQGSDSKPSESYREFRIVSIGSTDGFVDSKDAAGDPSSLNYHIMRIHGPKVLLSDLTPPIKLVRQVPTNAVQAALLKEDASLTTISNPVVPVPSSSSSSGPQTLESMVKMDPSKIAPFGNAQRNKQNLFKKKTKSFFFPRDPNAVGDDDKLKRKAKDPDRFPWLMTDFDNAPQHTFTGNLEPNRANYVLFMPSEDGSFQCLPASKWYKFTPRLHYQTLTIDEAEEKMSKIKRGLRSQDLWMMRKKKENGEDDDEVAVKDESSVEKSSAAPSRPGPSYYQDERRNRSRRPRNDDAEEEIDFDEMKSDDEDLNFGIEDEEEAKEAAKRQYGRAANRAFFGEDDDDEDDDEEAGQSQERLGHERKLKKYLRKNEKSDMYDSDDDRNPYVSEEDDDEDHKSGNESEEKGKKPETASVSASKDPAAPRRKKEQTPADLLRKKKDGGGSGDSPIPTSSSSRSPKPTSMMERMRDSPRTPLTPRSEEGRGSGSASPAGTTIRAKVSAPSGGASPLQGGPDAKRKREDDRNGDTKKTKGSDGKSPGPPLPPSTADVLREHRKGRLGSPMSSHGAGSTTPGGSSTSTSNYNAYAPKASSPLASRGESTASPPRSISPNHPSSTSPRYSNSPPRPIPSHVSQGSTPSGSSPGRSTPRVSGDPNSLLVDADIIECYHQRGNVPLTMKEIISFIRPRMSGLNAERNRAILKDIIKRLLITNKETMQWTIRDEYKRS